MTQTLFFNKKEKLYCLVCSDNDLNVYCNKCNKIINIEDYIFIQRSFTKKDYKKILYCDKCIKDYKTRIYDEFITAEVRLNPLPNSIINIEFPPSLSNCSNITVFEMADEEQKGVEIINKCKLSFKKEDLTKEIEQNKNNTEDRIKELDSSINNPLKYLEELQEAKPEKEGRLELNKELILCLDEKIKELEQKVDKALKGEL